MWFWSCLAGEEIVTAQAIRGRWQPVTQRLSIRVPARTNRCPWELTEGYNNSFPGCGDQIPRGLGISLLPVRELS